MGSILQLLVLSLFHILNLRPGLGCATDLEFLIGFSDTWVERGCECQFLNNVDRVMYYKTNLF